MRKTIKPLLSCLLVCGLLVSIVCVSVIGVSSTGTTHLLGDVDKSGDISVDDATAVQFGLAKITELDEIELYLANVDGEDGLDVRDVTYIQMYLSKMYTDLAVNTDGYKIGDEVSFKNIEAEFTVTFKDYDGTVLKTETVTEGSYASAPTNPQRDGYLFVGWDKSFDSVVSNLEITALYKKLDNPTIVMGSATADAGDKVVVSIDVHNNPGVNGVQLNVEYASELKLIKAEQGTALTALNLTLPSSYANPSKFLWDGISENETSNGTILNLTFEVPDDAKPGDIYALSVDYPKGAIYDVDLNDVDFDTVDGLITINGGDFVVPDTTTPETEPTTKPAPKTYTVVFKDYDGTVLKTDNVVAGESATAPDEPQRAGYAFSGWDKSFDNVIGDLVVTAVYEKLNIPTVEIGNVKAVAGTTVEVPVNIHNNPGINGIQLNVSYDSKLTLTKAVNGTALPLLVLTLPGSYSNPSRFLWDGMSDNETGNGTALILSFTVPADAKTGDTYAVSVDYPDGAIYDIDLNDVHFDTVNGSIIVS